VTDVLGWAYLWEYHPLYKGRSVKISMDIQEDGHISLDELKVMLINYLKDGWIFPKVHNEPASVWEERILSSKTHLDIIHLFMYDFD
jgi:hypothetical protein